MTLAPAPPRDLAPPAPLVVKETRTVTVDWDHLVTAARRDPAAVDDLLALVRPLVLRRCAKFLPHRHDAEEACNDALLAIATKLDTFTGQGSFEGWVTVIASNKARETYRTLRRRHETCAAHLVVEPGDPRTTSVIAGTRLDLLEAIDALERSQPRAAESFVLRDLGGLPYSDIAEITRAPLNTAKARVRAGRLFVRGRLLAE